MQTEQLSPSCQLLLRRVLYSGTTYGTLIYHCAESHGVKDMCYMVRLAFSKIIRTITHLLHGFTKKDVENADWPGLIPP